MPVNMQQLLVKRSGFRRRVTERMIERLRLFI